MAKPVDGDEVQALKKSKKLDIIGRHLYLNEYGLGMICGYNGLNEDTWSASLPQKDSVPAVMVNLCGEEIESGFWQFEHRNWA